MTVNMAGPAVETTPVEKTPKKEGSVVSPTHSVETTPAILLTKTGQNEVPVISPTPAVKATPVIVLAKTPQNKGSEISSTLSESKPKKKICCACPDTKRLRDECIVTHGEDACGKWIEAHLKCLRAEGFNI